MCRFAAYLGPPATLSSILFDAPHSLERQSYRPREMVTGTVNVDGTGVAWWPEGAAEPLRYVSAAPPWSDPNLAPLAARTSSGAQLSTVRSATPGLPAGVGAALPFVLGRHAVTHNGYVRSFREKALRPLIDGLPDHLLARLDVVTDSAVLFLHVMSHCERSGEAGLVGPLAAAVREVRELCARLGVEASLNLAVADGRSVAATRSSLGPPANSLYVLHDGARWPGAALLASEPLDDDAGWVPVPDESVVFSEGEGWRVEALDRAETLT